MTRLMSTGLGLALIAACAPEPEPRPRAANPAATYCIESGGRYDIRAGDDGQVGICTLPGGTEVDAWQHFRANNPA